MEDRSKALLDRASDRDLIEEAAKRGLGSEICEKQKELNDTIAWQVWGKDDVLYAVKKYGKEEGLDLPLKDIESLIDRVIGDLKGGPNPLEDCSDGWNILDALVRENATDLGLAKKEA